MKIAKMKHAPITIVLFFPSAFRVIRSNAVKTAKVHGFIESESWL